MRMGFGAGFIVTMLLSVVLLLLGLVNPFQTLSVFLALAGLWSIAFGLAFGSSGDRLYYTGWGLVAALGSTFSVIPLQYTVALVLLAVISVIVVSSVRRNRNSPTAQTNPQ